MGEIQDEYDVEEPLVVGSRETEARVDGRASIDDLVEICWTCDSSSRTRTSTTRWAASSTTAIGGIPQPGDEVRPRGADA